MPIVCVDFSIVERSAVFTSITDYVTVLGPLANGRGWWAIRGDETFGFGKTGKGTGLRAVVASAVGYF
jgi:hypothetical protein